VGTVLGWSRLSKASTASVCVCALKITIILYLLNILRFKVDSSYALSFISKLECDDDIVALKNPDNRVVVLIGTAHISEECVANKPSCFRIMMPVFSLIDLQNLFVGQFSR
jgi:hypothetical protein